MQMEATAIRAAFVVNWRPVSPNRTAGRHWTVKHRHRKEAGARWLASFAENETGVQAVRRARLALSSILPHDSRPADCSTGTTTCGQP